MITGTWLCTAHHLMIPLLGQRPQVLPGLIALLLPECVPQVWDNDHRHMAVHSAVSDNLILMPKT